MSYYARTREYLPPNGKGATSAWLTDKKLGEIVLHNLKGSAGGGKKGKDGETGSRDWVSCVTGEKRGDR